MRKHINQQLIRMLVVIAGLVAVTIFAWDFVYAGVMAKVALNGTIIGTFLFGFGMALWNTYQLRNEEAAFSALVEAWEDVRAERMGRQTDPYWRHYRCMEPAHVFERPKMLGHFFEMVYEEILRTRNLRLSVATMQNLVHGVEARLVEERSLTNYLSGTLVFLGLIGAFIGLIKMVHSVGAIIGGLAGAGGGDIFGKLIGELQGPLQGMSVGFSSSLFGLSLSLSIGLIARFQASAGHALTHEFEAWLATVAQVEKDESEDAIGAGNYAAASGNGQSASAYVAGSDGKDQKGAAVGGLPGIPPELLNLTRASNQAMDRVALGMHQVTLASEAQSAAYARSERLLERNAEHLQSMSAHQRDIATQISKLAVSSEHVKELHIKTLEVQETMETHLRRGLPHLTQMIKDHHDDQNERLDHLEQGQQGLALRMATIGGGNGDANMANVARSLELGLRTGFGELARNMAQVSRTQIELTQKLVQEVALLRSEPGSQPQGITARDLEVLSKSLEAGLARGMADMTKSLELFASSTRVVEVVSQPVAPAEPVAAAPVEPEPEPEPEVVIDHEGMVRKLYATLATQYKVTGTNG